MKNFLKILKILLFVVIIIITPIYYYTTEDTMEESENAINKEVDLEENRELNKLEYENIYDFPAAFEKFFDDHIPYRTSLIHTKRDIDSVIEKPYVNYIEDFLLNFGKKKKKIEENFISYEEKLMDYPVRQFTNHAFMPGENDEVEDTEYPVKISGSVMFGRKKWLFYNSNNIDYYKGNNLMTEKEKKDYLNNMIELDELCKKKNKNLIFLVIPDKVRTYSEYMPTIEREDEIGRIQRFKDYIATNSNIKFIYTKDVFDKNKKYYRLYRKYDTHYNEAGAYIAHNEILKNDNKDYIDIDDIRLDKTNDLQGGDLILLADLSPNNYSNDINYDIHYKDNIGNQLLYDEFDKKEDGNSRIEIFTSDANNQDTLLFLGDSFRNTIRPFLIKNYKLSIFVGSSYKKGGEIIKNSVDVANTIVIEMVERNEKEFLMYWIKFLKSYLK